MYRSIPTSVEYFNNVSENLNNLKMYPIACWTFLVVFPVGLLVKLYKYLYLLNRRFHHVHYIRRTVQAMNFFIAKLFSPLHSILITLGFIMKLFPSSILTCPSWIHTFALGSRSKLHLTSIPFLTQEIAKFPLPFSPYFAPLWSLLYPPISLIPLGSIHSLSEVALKYISSLNARDIKNTAYHFKINPAFKYPNHKLKQTKGNTSCNVSGNQINRDLLPYVEHLNEEGHDVVSWRSDMLCIWSGDLRKHAAINQGNSHYHYLNTHSWSPCSSLFITPLSLELNYPLVWL